MTDYFLKFQSEAHMLESLEPLGMVFVDEEGVSHVSQGGHQYTAWVVGEISGVEGWHLNLRVIDPEFDVSALEPYAVQPQNPVCVWA